jgi:hypothetical protein
MYIMLENKQRKNVWFDICNFLLVRCTFFIPNYKMFEFSQYIVFTIHLDVMSR